MKLLTTALALDTLGPEYKFRTTVETNGRLARNGKLSGDLILVGRGDPNLSNRKFPYESKEEFDGPPEKALVELADAIAARGVKKIAGDVVGDDSYFPRERYPDGWEIDDMVWEYGAAISAIVVDDNTVTLDADACGKGGRRGGGGCCAGNAGIRRKERSDYDWRERETGLAADARPGRRHGSGVRVMPAGSNPRKLVLAIQEPALHAANLLRNCFGIVESKLAARCALCISRIRARRLGRYWLSIFRFR